MAASNAVVCKGERGWAFGMIRLNLGCGRNKFPGYINIDIEEAVQPDLVWDVREGLPFRDDEVHEVRAFDFLEHVDSDKVIFVIGEIWRVLCPFGLFEHLTPSTDGRGAFQDPTHRSFWNINSWLYYMDDAHRALYGIVARFTGSNIDVVTDPVLKIVHTHGKLFADKGVVGGAQ